VTDKSSDGNPVAQIPYQSHLLRLPFMLSCASAVAENQPTTKNRVHKELSDFAARLREAIQGRNAALRHSVAAPRRPDLELLFDPLALELFALQFQHNAAYRKICATRGRTPRTVEHWTQIPAVPTAAFKELELSSISPEERDTVFYSSGTTGQEPSRHFHNAQSLAVYETSLSLWFERNVLRSADGSSAGSEKRGQAVRAPFGMICLTPPPEQSPHSSLVHMFETVRQKIGAAKTAFVGAIATDGAWTLDLEAALGALNSSRVTRHPSLLLGTAFSFVHLLDWLAENNLRVQLPTGSRVMETGGYKNRSRAMPKEELHALITEYLGVPGENIICEYGMSELSSQAYAVTGDTWQVTGESASSCHLSSVTGHFHFPPWARVQIVSPETGSEVADGETGLIRVLDLANVFSVMAVQTEDLGIRRGNGFELMGRAQFAEPRGCSLMTT
jgi:hypothetical protein